MLLFSEPPSDSVVVVDPKGAVVLANDAATPLLEASELPPSLKVLVDRALHGEQADAALELSGRAIRATARPHPCAWGRGCW